MVFYGGWSWLGRHELLAVMFIAGSKMTGWTRVSNLEHRLGDVVLDPVHLVQFVTVWTLLVLVVHLPPEAGVTYLKTRQKTS